MQKKSEEKVKLSKAIKEWMELLVQEEIHQGTPREIAEKVAVEVIHNLHLDATND